MATKTYICNAPHTTRKKGEAPKRFETGDEITLDEKEAAKFKNKFTEKPKAKKSDKKDGK